MTKPSDTLPIFIMQPHYKNVVWGGERIASFKEEASAGTHVGESWEVSDLPNAQSKVFDGNNTILLSELMEKYGEEILGKRLYRIFGNSFPLLVKIIDAKKDLSIQVHPDDYMAQRRHGSKGKTELWYTLAADDNAFVYSGLKNTVVASDLRKHIENDTVTELLAKFHPVHGDYFYLPAGRIHSAGAGMMVLEIQQPSDITYRIYDYKRPGLNGEMRQLHIEEALEATDFRIHDDYMRHLYPILGREQVLQECPHFTATLIHTGREPFELQVSRYLSFRIIVATQGQGIVIDGQGHTVRISRGHTLLVPATTEKITITPQQCDDLELVTAYIQ